MLDTHLAVASPVLAYWSLSLLFHAMDISGWQWLERYRIHDSPEVQSRNRATRREVVWAVIVQQLIQSIVAIFWVSDHVEMAADGHGMEMESLGRSLATVVTWCTGEKMVNTLLDDRGTDIVYFLYWWGIPTLQFAFAMFFIDTWQYFLHRGMHINKFLYKHLHSVHHRLYVPYAFGALYNHPIEGLILDSLGTALAESLSLMTTRQAVFLFSFSTFKTVDDHCGYRLPFDPFQLFAANNADYHDIHHQAIGIKSNFSQPFFVHWDVLLGTRMTREDIALRKKTADKAK